MIFKSIAVAAALLASAAAGAQSRSEPYCTMADATNCLMVDRNTPLIAGERQTGSATIAVPIAPPLKLAPGGDQGSGAKHPPNKPRQ